MDVMGLSGSGTEWEGSSPSPLAGGRWLGKAETDAFSLFGKGIRQGSGRQMRVAYL